MKRNLSMALLVVASTSYVSSYSQKPRLNPSIGPADTRQYANVRDAQAWRNPKLVIQADGVVVQARGIDGRKHVALVDLEQVLASLPKESWPYGRVIMQSDQSVLPVPSDQYRQKMGETRTAVAKLLKELDIKAELWASA